MLSILKVVSILPAIFWRQHITWSYCAGSQRFGFLAWRNWIPTKRSLCLENAVLLLVQWLCVMAAMPMVFSLTLTLPTFLFFSLLLFRLC